MLGVTEIHVLWMRKGDNTSQPEFTVKNAKLRVEKVVTYFCCELGDDSVLVVVCIWDGISHLSKFIRLLPTHYSPLPSTFLCLC